MIGIKVVLLGSYVNGSFCKSSILPKVDNASLEGVYGHHTTQPCQSSLTAMEIGA